MTTRRIFAVIAIVACLACVTSARTTQYLPEQGVLFEQALAQLRLDPADVRIDQRDLALWGGDKYRLPVLTNFLDNPWKISGTSRSITDGLLKYNGDIATLAGSAHSRTGHGVRLSLLGDPLEDYKARVEEIGDDALAVALAGLTGGAPEDYYYNDITMTDYAALPPAVRDAAAVFLLTVPDMLNYYELGMVEPLADLGLDPDTAREIALGYIMGEDEEQSDIETVLAIEAMLDNIDWDLFNTGAALVLSAAQGIQDALTAEGVDLGGDFYYSVDTPYGQVVLNGDADNRYYGDPALLVIDTGGAESYVCCAANQGSANPISVCIDLAGIDAYFEESQTRPAFGAGVFGYAVLIDNAGDDWYTMGSLGLGCGIFGTGALLDCDGNDAYHGKTNVQGTGVFGHGVLADCTGDDYYWLYQYGQGYGYTMGCGLLVDGTGNDHYNTELKDDPNGGPFGAERFIHFAQGAGYGRRADYVDGHSWAGGVGILTDGAGDDRYDCEVYGQGTGYWYALGICADKSGDDYHNAGWYSLGGSPHMGVGVFQDDAGDDRYYLTHMQSLGNGRDFSVGWFEDCAGDDWYQGGIMTFGVGDINGIGVFWDKGGDDTYLAHGPCFGQSRIENAGSIRDDMLTLGMFVDGGGNDRYFDLTGTDHITARPYPVVEDVTGLPEFGFTGNGVAWTRPTNQNETPGAMGCAIDALED